MSSLLLVPRRQVHRLIFPSCNNNNITWSSRFCLVAHHRRLNVSSFDRSDILIPSQKCDRNLLLLLVRPSSTTRTTQVYHQIRGFFRGQDHGYGFKIIKPATGRASKLDILFAGTTLSILAYLFIDLRAVYEAIAPESMVQATDKYYEKTVSSVKRLLKLDAAAINASATAIEPESGNKKEKVGFRERKIIEYENRIRMYSAPAKIFNYFATIKVVTVDNSNDSEIMMKPEDFLRALTPGARQPDNLCLDQFRKVEVRHKDMRELDEFMRSAECKKNLSEDSIFYKLSDRGLINFTDFLFLLTVLSVSRRHFEIAFRMFDLNGDGDVDYEEFARVQSAIMSQTSIGQKLDRSAKSSVASSYRGVSSALSKYFFGKDLTGKLTIDKFLEFQKSLQHEILRLEFNGKNPVDGRIKEIDFADLLIAYAGFPENKKQRMLKRIKKKFKSGKLGGKAAAVVGESDGEKNETQSAESVSIGITESEYSDFHHFLQNINDVDIALTFFKYGSQGIDAATLKRAAKTVANINLSDHMVDVIFTLFDEDQDGFLSNREFISVMKERVRRGLSRPKDTGFTRIVTAFVNSFKFNGFFL